MSFSREFGRFIILFINAIRDENIRWQQKNLPALNELERQRKISKFEIEEELKRRQIKFANEIVQLEMEAESKIQDFKEFLDAIDKIKNDIRQHFEQVSLPVALLIHQHGKRLLIQMWHSGNIHDRKKYEQELFDFLFTVNEDIYLNSLKENKNKCYMPEKTIKLIRQNEAQED